MTDAIATTTNNDKKETHALAATIDMNNVYGNNSTMRMVTEKVVVGIG